MSGVEQSDAAAQIAIGFILAACAGLRAFLPPLAIGLAARAGLLELSERFEWMGSNPALIVLSVAVLLELVGDKVPFVDNILDVSGTVLRPAAGALAALAPLFGAVHALEQGGADSRALPWLLGIAGAGTGAGLSAGVHLLKSQVRLVSSAATAGVANPFLSIVEDIVSLLGVALAILVPLLALVLAILIVALTASVVRRRRAPASRT